MNQSNKSHLGWCVCLQGSNMAVDPELYIVEVGQERGRVIDTFLSSLTCKPPPPVPLRLFNMSDSPYHIVTVSVLPYIRFVMLSVVPSQDTRMHK